VTLRATYQEWLELSLELVRRHAPDGEDIVFGANAVRCYQLEADP
jgi:predicted TIM-barrel fold metal-dependent hydrolase